MHLGSDWVAGCRLWIARLREGNARGGSLLQALRSSWSHPVDRARDASSGRGFCSLTAATRQEGQLLDEQTWSELDMDPVFARIDRTHSSVGQLVLQEFLRNPTGNTQLLAERHRVIELFLSSLRERSPISCWNT